jgi:WD40 repeat protein
VGRGQSLAGGAGTDEYMAPEQWEDDPACPRELADADGRTDVYGLGAVLYELLTGRPPFLRGAHRNETRRRVRFDEPTPPRALCKTVPRDLESICLRCLRKRPLDRFATAKDVADALDRFVHGYPPSESSLLTRAVYLIRRHRTLTATACSGLLLFGLVMSLFVTTRWIHLRSEALHKFEAGRKSVADGQISEGYDRMRSSIDHLPFGEKFFRDYFVRSVAALGANLSLEVARFAHASQILAAAASPDGRYILLGDEVGHTALWDLAANTNISLPTRSGRPSILAVAFNQTGALCSSGDYDGNVTVWDVHSRRVIWESHLDYQASFLGFIGNGNRLLTGTAEGEGPQMRIWDVLQNGGKELLVDSEDLRSKRASDVVVSPTGDRFVSISLRRSRCLLWDADTVRVIADLSDQPATPHPPDNPIGMCATFSADGSRLAVAGAKLTIHDSRTGAAVRRVDVCRGAHVHCVALRDDGGATLVIGKGRVAAVRRVTPDLEIWDDVPIDQPIGALCAVNVGDTIVSATYAHHTSLVAVTDSTDRVQVFDVSDESFAHRAEIEQAGAALSPLAFGPTDDTLYVKGDHGVHRWDVRAMKPIDPVISFFDEVSTFCLSSTPEAVIAITKTGKMILRTVSRQVSGCRAVVGLQPSPVDPK